MELLVFTASRVCVRVVGMHLFLGTVQFLHLSLQPTRPTHYLMRIFCRDHVTCPMGVLVCLHFC